RDLRSCDTASFHTERRCHRKFGTHPCDGQHCTHANGRFYSGPANNGNYPGRWSNCKIRERALPVVTKQFHRLHRGDRKLTHWRCRLTHAIQRTWGSSHYTLPTPQ